MLKSFVIGSAMCAALAFVLLRVHDVAADDNATEVRDATAGSDAKPNACFVDTAGGVYAHVPCTVTIAHRAYLDRDGGPNATPRIFVKGERDSLDVRLVVQVFGVPKVGRQADFYIIGTVEKKPATWRVMAGPYSGTTGRVDDLTLTDVRKIHVDGGASYEMHGTFVTTLPEITGVRGPDVVLSGRF